MATSVGPDANLIVLRHACSRATYMATNCIASSVFVTLLPLCGLVWFCMSFHVFLACAFVCVFAYYHGKTKVRCVVEGK